MDDTTASGVAHQAMDDVQRALSRALEDAGWEVTPWRLRRILSELRATMNTTLKAAEAELKAMPDILNCPPSGCGTRNISRLRAVLDAQGNLHCPKCGAVIELALRRD